MRTRLGCVMGAAAAAALLVLPQAAPAAGAAGSVYGGVTAQVNPVVVEFNRSRHRMTRMVIALNFDCTSNTGFTFTEQVVAVKVRKNGRFSTSYNDTRRNDDGSSTNYKGSVSGVLNRARTKVTGRYTDRITDSDAAGAVTDTCNSGTVKWSAKQ